jgi:hypothetical protein
MQNSFSMKASRLSTRKKDSKMNRRGALTAEEQGSSRGTTTAAETEAASAAETDGKQEES